MCSEIYREDGQHLPLSELEEELRELGVHHKYIGKEDIPTYPRPELHVSHISHDTDLNGFWGIVEDGEFMDPNAEEQAPNNQGPKVVWFSLTVSADDLSEAETRDMTLVHPGGQEEVLRPKGYSGRYALPEGGTLWDFATSPAFSSRSRYGSFRFTFSLEDVLDKYSQQFCRGREPVLRVFRTVLYKQAVMYAVLVHSPIKNKKFSRFPLLEDVPDICEYSEDPEPHFVWRPQAMSGTHRIGLEVDYGELNAEEYEQEHYVWDHVALALHVGTKSLEFEDYELRKSLRFCEKDDVTVPKDDHYVTFQSFGEAEAEVQKQWPYYHLRRFNNSGKFHIHN